MTEVSLALAGAEEAPARDTDRGSLRVAHAGAWALAGYVASAGATFGVSVMVGRALGPAGFGTFSYYLWLLRLLPGLLTLGIPYALSKHIPERVGAGDTAGARALTSLALRLHLAFLALPTLAAALVAWVRDRDVLLAGAVAAAAGAAVLAVDLDGVLAGLKRFELLTKLGVAMGAAQIALAVGGLAAGLGARGFVALMSFAALLNTGALWVTGRRLLIRMPTRSVTREERSIFLRFAGLMAMSLALDALIFGRMEVFFIDLWRSGAEVGYYNAAIRLWALAGLLPMVAARVLLPEFATHRGAGRHDELRELYPRVCAVIALVSVPIACGGAAVSAEIVKLGFGERFAPAAAAGVVLALGSLVGAVSVPANLVIVTGPRPRVFVEVGVFVLALNVVLDVVLIPRFGIVGAASANVASQIVAVLAGALIAWRWYGFRYPLADVTRVLVAGAACAAAARTVLVLLHGGFALPAAVCAGALAYAGGLRLWSRGAVASLRVLWTSRTSSGAAV